MRELRTLATLVMILAGVLLLYRLLGLPSSDEIEQAATNLVLAYGYAALFLAALLESMFVVGLYFPGSTLVVVGVALASTRGFDLISLAGSIGAGALLGYIWDYALGRLGWYALFGPARDPALARMRRFVERRGRIALVLAVVHPFFGAPAAVSAGLLRLRPLQFGVTIAIATGAWAVLWTTVLYALGARVGSVASFFNLAWVVLGLAFVLTIATILRVVQVRRHEV